MERSIKEFIGAKHSRTFDLRADGAIVDDTDQIALAFSSEEPFERWFGIEVLDHSPGAVATRRTLKTFPPSQNPYTRLANPGPFSSTQTSTSV